MATDARGIARILTKPGAIGVFQDTTDGVWLEEDGHERKQRDYLAALTPDMVSRIRSGYTCMYCYEPQSGAFADEHLPGCKGVTMHGPRFMRDRQTLEFTMQFEGEVMVGPQRPLREFLDKQEERAEKRKWAIKRAERGAEIPDEFLRDATLLGGE